MGGETFTDDEVRAVLEALKLLMRWDAAAANDNIEARADQGDVRFDITGSASHAEDASEEGR